MAKVLLLASMIAMVISINNAIAETCTASVYWVGSFGQRGTQTASGIPLNNNALTAAHKTARLGTKMRITNLSNNKFTIVRITDRGPYVRGRCIDLTKASAKAIGCNGLCKVRVE